MGLAVAIALFLLVVAVVLALAAGVVWGAVQAAHMGFVAARSVVRRGRW